MSLLIAVALFSGHRCHLWCYELVCCDPNECETSRLAMLGVLCRFSAACEGHNADLLELYALELQVLSHCWRCWCGVRAVDIRSTRSPKLATVCPLCSQQKQTSPLLSICRLRLQQNPSSPTPSQPSTQQESSPSTKAE